MEDAGFFGITSFLLTLLNPLLVIVYLVDLLKGFTLGLFARVLMRASLISMAVFIAFALFGHAIFVKFLQLHFASFQIFGGIVFLLIGIRFVFQGNAAIESLRGEPGYVAGAIAMPIMIGPGTISACVLAGQRLPPMLAVLSVSTAVLISTAVMIGLKALHDYVRPRREQLVERYVEIAGRITAMFVGTVAIEMIMKGGRDWIVMMRTAWTG